MTEEEKAEMEAAAGEEPGASASAAATASTPADAPAAAHDSPAAGTTTTGTHAAASAGPGTDLAHHTSFNSLPSGATTPNGVQEKPAASTVGASNKESAAAKKGKSKLTVEQKAKLAELEEAKDKERVKRWVLWERLYHLSNRVRVDLLAKKLIQRIRPFVDAKHPVSLQSIKFDCC